jgi:hypothetical protein
MSSNRRELILKEEAYEVVGCALEVLNELGHGLLEKPYENALVVEFGMKGIPVQPPPRYEVKYQGACGWGVCAGSDRLWEIGCGCQGDGEESFSRGTMNERESLENIRVHSRPFAVPFP